MRNHKNRILGLLPLPGGLLALLPSASCPACITAYAGVLSALGLSFLFTASVQLPLILVFLALGVASIAWSTRSHRHTGPLVLTVVGSLAVTVDCLLWNSPLVLYGGVTLLVVAALWNLWLKRPQSGPLVQLHSDKKGTMIMKKRTIEIFTAGCPVCEETVKLVESLSCPSCDVRVLDMRTNTAAQAKARGYGVKRLPSVVINGKLADCCQQGGVDANTLRALGVGVA